MSVRLVDRVGSAIATRTSRRSFISKSALAGTALATVPVAYTLRPGTAYAAICTCNNQSCDCGDTCCDGYTEFCCTLTGENTCPTDTVPAGWWKVDGSSFCTASGVPGPRYYLDCNAVPSGPCGAAGVTRLTDQCDCSCAEGNCGNRKACCTAFRYGQCAQSISCLGPIVCRVVTCTPPWRFDPTCTTATATDNNTRFHNRPCLERPTPTRGALPAYFRDGAWTLGYSRGNEDEVETVSFNFGRAGDIPIMGDWNGDGTWTVGVVRRGANSLTWFLRNENSGGLEDVSFEFGAADDIPIVGDWNGNGVYGIGVRKANEPIWEVRQTPTGGAPDQTFQYGQVTDTPVTGDWNGNGRTGIGVVRENQRTIKPTNRWRLRHTATEGEPHRKFWSGSSSDLPYVSGDWNEDGRWRPGRVNESGRWLIHGEDNFNFGGPGDIPLVWRAGHWTPGELPQ